LDMQQRFWVLVGKWAHTLAATSRQNHGLRSVRRGG
jgi:hypothetical protein